MEFQRMGPEDLLEILKNLKKAIDEDVVGGLEETPVATITPEEEARFAELDSRLEAVKADIERVKSKLLADRNRLWADLMDKYNLHGANLKQEGRHLYKYK